MPLKSTIAALVASMKEAQNMAALEDYEDDGLPPDWCGIDLGGPDWPVIVDDEGNLWRIAGIPYRGRIS